MSQFLERDGRAVTNLDSLHHPKEEEDNQEDDESSPAWHGLSYERHFIPARLRLL